MYTKSIKEVLMKRDGLTEEEANNEILIAKVELDYYITHHDYESADNICQDCFGLEPDYIMDLI